MFSEKLFVQSTTLLQIETRNRGILVYPVDRNTRRQEHDLAVRIEVLFSIKNYKLHMDAVHQCSSHF